MNNITDHAAAMFRTSTSFTDIATINITPPPKRVRTMEQKVRAKANRKYKPLTPEQREAKNARERAARAAKKIAA